MNLEEFHATVLLTLGPPDQYAVLFDIPDDYEKQFYELCDHVDLLGYKTGCRYPLSLAERNDNYRKIYRDFIWWFRNRSPVERNW